MLKHPEKIIIIDDDQAYAKQLKQVAQKYRLLATCFTNLDDAIEALELDASYRFVILDNKCMVNSSQREKPKSSFVIKAIQELDELYYEHDRLIDYCINAEPLQGMEELLGDTAPIFYKYNKQSETKLMEHIVRTIKVLPMTQIKYRYEKPTAFAEQYLSSSDVMLLYTIVQEMDQNDSTSLISCLSMLRRLEESVVDCGYHLLLPRRSDLDRMSRDQGRSKTKIMIDRLYSKRLIPHHIKSAAYHIYGGCSRYGSHQQSTGELPGEYFVQSLCFALFEIMAFFTDIEFKQKSRSESCSME